MRAPTSLGLAHNCSYERLFLNLNLVVLSVLIPYFTWTSQHAGPFLRCDDGKRERGQERPTYCRLCCISGAHIYFCCSPVLCSNQNHSSLRIGRLVHGSISSKPTTQTTTVLSTHLFQGVFTLSCIFVLNGVSYGLGKHNSALSQDDQIQALKVKS